MIRLGLRLALAGGREAITRLALIAVAVAIGVGLLLSTLAGLNAVNNQNARYAWLETGDIGSNAPSVAARTTKTPAQAPSAADPLWWLLRADYYQGKIIGRVELAATGTNSPVPPGIAALPGRGEFYASPALVTLLRQTPRAQLGDRFPGRLVGTIGPAALPSPDSLIIIIGRSVAEVSHRQDAELVTRISTTSPSQCSNNACAVGVGTNHNGIVLILAVVAAALLFPVLIFIGAATRLSAARREQRFAAMRLVGATPRQISTISTVEAAVATVVGVAAGFGLFFALRPLLANIPFTEGGRFFTTDLSLNVPDVLFVVLGVPIGAAAAARLALRRVSISPLGVTRRVTPRPPRPWRLLPLLVGIAELGYFAYLHDIGAGTNTDTTLEAVLFLIGVLLVMAGLVIAGPWLTMLGSKLVIWRANRPAALIAARRLADNPQAGFRAISGLVLAVFVGTCAIAIITTIGASGTTSGLGDAADSTLVETLWQPRTPHRSTPADAATTRALASIPGVTGVAVIHDQAVSPLPPPSQAGQPTEHLPAPLEQVASCADIAAIPALGHCPPGATAVTIRSDFVGAFGLSRERPMREITWSSLNISLNRLQRLPIDTVVVGTNGSRSALERARTVLDLAYPTTFFPPQTSGEMEADQSRLLDDYKRLADVVILTSLPIAGCSLAVSIAGGLIERKRPFSLLRLAGTPIGVLRRVVGLEAAAPLLITAAASVGAAFLAAHLFLRAQLQQTLQPPGMTYYLILGAGLLASLTVIASTLPLLNRVTGPETARNE